MAKLFHKISTKEKAQTMVEFALVFPLLLLITYGIIEFGRMLFIYTSITNAAREGARYGAAAGDVAAMTRTPHYADCDGILAAVHSSSFLIQVDDSNIIIEYDHGPDRVGDVYQVGCPPYDANGTDMVRLHDRILVSVTARYDPILPTGFIGFSGFDITAKNARTILTNIEIIGKLPTSYPTESP